MKRIVALLFCGILISNAQSVNVDDLNGFKNVEFTKIEGNKVRFTHKDGAGIMPLSDLPKDILEKVTRDLPRVDMTAKQEAEAKARREKVRELFREDFGGKLSFTVLQVVEGGVLIKLNRGLSSIKKVQKKVIEYKEYETFGSTAMGRSPSYDRIPVESIQMVSQTIDLNTGREPIFLYCNTKDMYDGKSISGVEVYPAGTYTYDSVGKVTKTVKALSTDLDKSLQMLLNSLEPETKQK